MVQFGFTEAQEMLRREVKDFAQRELAPGAKERAKSPVLPRDLIRRMGELGFLGISLPEKYGGQGADWVSLGIVVEELSKVDLGMGMLPMGPALAYLCLQQGAEEVKEEWLPPLIRGEKIPCFCVTEPDCGSDAAAMKTVAMKDGDYYVIKGEKSPISSAWNADAAILFAKTDPTARARGVTCFWVPLDLPGISRTLISHSGWKWNGVASLFFDEVRLHSKYRVGEEGKGFYIFAAGGADYLRVCLALVALAIAQTSLEEAMNYALQRTAFGQPIGRFEGVSFKIAEHATLIEAARLLCYRTLSLKDQGLKHTKESAMCKWWCPEVAFNAIHDCVLIHGHIGYSEEYPLEQRLRDALGFEFADGTAEIMKIIIAREIMGRVAVPY
jgi:cyclohexanecarboxyl-CoA dehydrogenase